MSAGPGAWQGPSTRQVEQRSVRPREEESMVRLRRVDLFGPVEFLRASHRAHAYPRHSHDEFVIAAMTRGIEALRHTRGLDHVSAGSLILLNPGDVHSNHSIDRSGFAYRTAYVSPEVVSRMLSEGSQCGMRSPVFQRPVISEPSVYRMILRLHDAVDATESRLVQEALLVKVVAFLFRINGSLDAAPAGRNTEPARLREVRDYIDANLGSGVSLGTLSSLTGLSPFQLVNEFRRVFGIPPHQYQLNGRLSLARRLLRGGMPISDVAIETGFSDQSHLTRHFKKFLGLTPGQFLGTRKNVQDRV
ncbi:MAG: AraC family transcriptional regulator [Pirellulales bacterium]